MAESKRLVTAAEMDVMAPDERAAVINEAIVTNWDELPRELQETVTATAQRLADELG